MSAPGKSVGVVTLIIVSFLVTSAHMGWTKLQADAGGDKKLLGKVPVASNSETLWKGPNYPHRFRRASRKKIKLCVGGKPPTHPMGRAQGLTLGWVCR